jgi:hypothetical protein
VDNRKIQLDGGTKDSTNSGYNAGYSSFTVVCDNRLFAVYKRDTTRHYGIFEETV